MVQIIAGRKGKGKTKYLLGNANEAIRVTDGTIVYLDKSTQHIHELDNRIRLVNITDYPVASTEAFIGFICGLAASDYDLQEIYVDSFLKAAAVTPETVAATVDQLDVISEQNHVKIVLSVSEDAVNLPESVQEHITISL
ncbi:MAG: twitching motility protein PilT [Lachnospiraceae bacterium]|nr:twitching motility protein PilT [Lachnospiraceae bacterium]